MYGYVLQDWITMALPVGGTTIQNESDWLAFSSFQDIVFWIDVKSVTAAATVTINLQTSPTKDESLFNTLTNCTAAPTNLTAPVTTVVKNLLSTNPAFPLATWVRWTLSASAATTITFRILASANRVAA